MRASLPHLPRGTHSPWGNGMLLALLGGALRACLVLCLSGLPATLHFILVPHQWCAYHLQVEHAADRDSHHNSSSHNLKHSAIDQSSRDETTADHDVCSATLSTSPSLGLQPLALASVCACESEVPGFEVLAPPALCAPLSFAPKRSPPAIRL